MNALEHTSTGIDGKHWLAACYQPSILNGLLLLFIKLLCCVSVASYCYPNKPMDSAVINMTAVHQHHHHQQQAQHSQQQHQQTQQQQMVTAISPPVTAQVAVTQPMSIDTSKSLQLIHFYSYLLHPLKYNHVSIEAP